MNKFGKLILVLIVFLSTSIYAQGKTMIDKAQLDGMFKNISENTNWDLKKPLLWGYFFTDKSKEKLRAAGSLLEKEGYRFVDIYQAKDEHDEVLDYWWLHVEKVEVHTADSLHERNMLFYKFAEQHGLETYDGMDVGPVTQKH